MHRKLLVVAGTSTSENDGRSAHSTQHLAMQKKTNKTYWIHASKECLNNIRVLTMALDTANNHTGGGPTDSIEPG
jgi:hypothetical protein